MRLRQVDAAAALGVNAVQLSEWENGKWVPKSANLQRLADFYGVTTEWLLKGGTYPGLAVPRGTSAVRESGPAYGDAWSALIIRTDREAARLRATEAEADFLAAALQLPQARALVAQGGAGEAGAADLARSLLDWLSAWVKQREVKPKRRAGTS